VLFAHVVATSETVAATRARSRKVAELADLLRRLEPDEVPIVVAILAGAPRQGRIGIGWRTVAKLQVEPADEPSLTVTDVDEALTAVDGMRGPGSQAARSALLTDVFSRATAPEQDLIGRLLVGELRHGALAGVLTDAVAKAADIPLATVRRAAMLAGDLPRVAAIGLAGRTGSGDGDDSGDGGDGGGGGGGAAALAAIGLVLLQPVQPMLAQSAGDVAEALEQSGGGLASVEWKLDGARIQVHRVGDEVRIYTRNLNEVTDRLPGIVELVRRFPAERLLLDGEAVGLGEDEAPDLFQDTISRFSRQTQAAVAVPMGLEARFFDVLHVDGEDLIDLPLTERLDNLERVAGPWRITGRLTDDPEVAAEVLTESLAAGHEGVMVKAAGSPYEAGRRGGAWRKVKPVHTLDLVVLAVEWGSGRREGWLSNLHLGARDPEGGFVMVGKTFKGLTDELLTWQTERFLGLESGREGHVVHVRPEQVVEIALDGVQTSTRYAGGVALRFARVRRYRDDKGPEDADTIAAVRALSPTLRS
jgi:DNA ligase-1